MSDALRFLRLEVRRMPGFPGGGIRLEELSPGINLVHGPNASGKTTAAVALQSLLWPSSAPAVARVEGLFGLGGADWRVDVDARRPAWQREGRESAAPPLPPRDTRDRYLLSLHSLLVTDDAELAARIRVETAGGYDVDAASQALGFRSPGAPRSLTGALAEARRALAEARDREASLRDEAAELERLRARLAEVSEAAAGLEALDRALELARARAALADAERALAAFPAGVARLRGDELERLAEWDRAVGECDAALAEAGAREAGAARELEALGLDDDGVPVATLSALESKLDALRRLDGERDRAREARAEAAAVRARAGAALGVDPDREPVPEPAVPAVERLDRLVLRAESLRARRAALEARAREAAPSAEAPADGTPGADTHGADTPSDTAPGDTAPGDTAPGDTAPGTDDAARLLRRWLRTADGAGGAGARLRTLLHAAIAVLGAAGLAALVLGAAPLKALGAALVLAAGALLALRPPPPAGRAELERELERLGHAPKAWTVRSVEDALDALERAAAAEQVASRRREDAARAVAELADVAAAEAELAAERDALREETGLAPEAGDLALHHLATRLRAWAEARDAEAEADGRARELEARRVVLIEEAGALLEPFGHDAADGDAVAAGLQALRTRREAHQRLVAEREKARESAEAAAGKRAEVQARRAELFARLELEPDEEHRVRAWADQLADHDAARTELDVARRAETVAAEALAAVATATGAHLGSAPLPELEAARAAAAEAAREEGELRERVAGIEARLDQARRKHDVEEALSRVAEAESDLLDQREADTAAEVGLALVEWLRESVSDRHRPAVFHRAREIFRDITRGRYRLDLEDREGLAFRAYDTTTHRGHGLDELSSGTRVQLLLAVRVAFVETQETGVALPLLLDEVLANSDDERAAAIIDAALALARAGRQLFYFTAQADELVKWKARLEAQDDVDWRVRGILDGRAGEGPAMDWTPARPPAVPAPEGRDHAAYGRALGVPPFDPWADGIGGVHLWYLMDDVDALHRLLDMGIERWGQLDFLTAAGHKVSDALRGVVDDARRAANLCDRFRVLWRQGRGRPVDRVVLEASGAVSEAFIDPVAELCQELDGDGAALIQALEDRRVPRFRSAQTDALRDYFLAEGHLSEEEPLPPDWIRLTLATEAAARHPALSAGAVDALVARLVRGPGVPA